MDMVHGKVVIKWWAFAIASFLPWSFPYHYW
jgi:hypothetical protein